MERQNTELRQDQIKQAVLEIIFSEGLKKLSTRRLAKKVGLSEGAIFRHFASKKDIILAIMEDVKDQLLEPLRRIANSSESPEKRLKQLMCTTIKYLVANQGITILLLSEASQENDADLKNNLNLIFNTQRSLMKKVVTDGISEGLWSSTLPVDTLTMLYMGIPVSLNVELVLNQKVFDETAFCNEMFAMILKVLQ